MMAKTFTARPLTGEMALQAYPLIQVTRSDLSLDEWRDFVRDQSSVRAPDRGIIALVNGRGYLQGMYCYHVENHGSDGSVLEVENAVAVDLFRPAVAAEALHRSMNETACKLSCQSLHVAAPNGDGSLKDYFDTLGFNIDAIPYCAPCPKD